MMLTVISFDAVQVEVFGVAKDERDASALYDEFQTTFWNLYQVLSDQMPIRLVARCARNLTVSEAGHVDVQAWSYSQQQFVTVWFISMFTSKYLSYVTSVRLVCVCVCVCVYTDTHLHTQLSSLQYDQIVHGFCIILLNGFRNLPLLILFLKLVFIKH